MATTQNHAAARAKPLQTMQNHPPLRWAGGLCRLALALFALTPGARADVTTVAWYRLGEQDPGAASGQVVSVGTRDVMDVNPLRRFGSPVYMDQVSSGAANRVGSSLAVIFNGANQMYTNAVVGAGRSNFGIEAWVAPLSTVQGTHLIATTATRRPMDGAWLWRSRGQASSATTASLGAGSRWAPARGGGGGAHVALVRDNGICTFYVNGADSGSSSVTPVSPAGFFAIAGSPQLLKGAFFPGAIDEVRVFTFGPGRFDTADSC